jgi:hypothetical protein
LLAGSCPFLMNWASATLAQFFRQKWTRASGQVCGYLQISMWLEAAGAILFSSCILVTLKLRPSRQTCQLAHVHFWQKNWAIETKSSPDSTGKWNVNSSLTGFKKLQSFLSLKHRKYFLNNTAYIVWIIRLTVQ